MGNIVKQLLDECKKMEEEIKQLRKQIAEEPRVYLLMHKTSEKISIIEAHRSKFLAEEKAKNFQKLTTKGKYKIKEVDLI